MCRIITFTTLALIGLLLGCQSPSKTTTSCDLSEYGIEEAGICTRTKWQYPSHRIVRHEGLSETTQQFAYRTWDSTHFAQDDYGLTISHHYEVAVRPSGLIDSTWSVVHDSLNGAIPWYRYKERHQRNAGEDNQLVERSYTQYRSASRKDFLKVQMYYRGGRLLDSIKVERQGDHRERTTDKLQERLSQYLRFSQTEEERQRLESYVLTTFDLNEPSNYYGHWSDSTPLAPEFIRYEHKLDHRRPCSMLIEWQPTAPLRYWTLAHTRAVYEEHLPLLEPYLEMYRATVLVLLNERGEPCSLAYSIRRTPSATLEESSKTFGAGCTENNAYGRLSISIATPSTKFQ